MLHNDVAVVHLDPNVPLPKERNAPALQTFSARALQSMEFEPVRYVVPGYVAEGLTVLAGKPKLGKSWLALDWALAVSQGGYAFGSVACRQGDVLYAALEDNQRRLQRRIAQLFSSDTEWPERLSLCCEAGRLNEGLLDSIEAWASEAECPQLVVIDTLAKVRPPRGRQDTNYDADYAALGPLQELAGRLSLAIVVIHHVRKMDADDPLDTVSGTTGLTGAADSVLVLNRDSQGVTLYGRGRDIEEIETALMFDQLTGQWTILGDAETVRRSDERKAIIDVLEESSEDLGPKEIAELTGQTYDAVRQMLPRMVRDGEILSPKR